MPRRLKEYVKPFATKNPRTFPKASGGKISLSAVDGARKASSAFAKGRSAAREVFNRSISHDRGLRGTTGFLRWLGNVQEAAVSDASKHVNWMRAHRLKPGVNKFTYGKPEQWVARQATKGLRGLNKSSGFVRKFGGAVGLAVGALAMLSVGVMRGANNTGKEMVFERYMEDQRYSRSMLMNSRVGLASGTGRMQRYGSTEGLAGALHKNRHGRGF